MFVQKQQGQKYWCMSKSLELAGIIVPSCRLLQVGQGQCQGVKVKSGELEEFEIFLQHKASEKKMLFSKSSPVMM